MRKFYVLVLLCLTILFYGFSLALSAEYSSDPNDFNPIKNTAWMFSFSHGETNYTKIVGFLPETIIFNDKGDLALGATDTDLRGVTLYGDKIGGEGKAFICTLQDQTNKSIYNIYQFNIDGNIAIGRFAYLNETKSSAFWDSFLLGVKILDKVIIDQNQPIQIDQNQIKNILEDQNQPDINKSVDSESSSGGGGCFIQIPKHCVPAP